MFKTKDRSKVEALAEQVHGGVERTCGVCGVQTRCASDAVRVAHGLDGRDQVYGVCATCSAAEACRGVVADAVRTVLGVDVDRVLLEGVTVDKFANLAHTSPDRPNRRRWSHVRAEPLGEQIEFNRADAVRRAGGPCAWCGVTITPPDTAWGRDAEGPTCGSCQNWFGGANGLIGVSSALRRTVAVQALAKLTATAGTYVQDGGFGAESGLLFFHESGRTQGSSSPWAHVDIATLDARVSAMLRDGLYMNLRPGGWTPDWTPNRAKKVLW